MKQHEHVHLLHGRLLRLRLSRNQRARHLKVSVCRRQGAVVTMPRWATQRDVEAMLAEAADWLAAQATRHDVWDGPRRQSWATGSELPLLDGRLRLDIRPLPPEVTRSRATLVGDELRLELSVSECLDPRPALRRWVRAFAGQHLRARTAALGTPLGLLPRRIMVGERTSRWGSCSSRGTISYCYRLVLAPSAVVDAVVVHELCHLVQLDHGHRWHALVTRAYPEHDACMDWLREHGLELDL